MGNSAEAISAATRATENSAIWILRSSRLGWIARNRMANRSCNTSTPRVTRPASVSSSRFSYSTLTMITVLDSATAAPR